MTETKRGSVIRSCEQCSKEFPVYLSTLAAGKGRCCSKACDNKLRIGKSAPKSKTRSDKKPRKPHVCQWCGKVFINETNGGADEPRVFCSNACSGRSKKKDRREHPRQKQSNELSQWARKVILRDKKCIRCGSNGPLQAHHIKPYSKYPELRLDVENGASLCPVCHHAQHPKHKLEWYLLRGGRTVQRCIACESEFVPHKLTQRTCSVGCGAKLRQGRRSYTKNQEIET